MAEFSGLDWFGLFGTGVGLAGSFYALWTKVSVAQKDASTALQVVAQHGDEFNEVRSAVDRLREKESGDVSDLRSAVGRIERTLNSLHCSGDR